MFLLGDEFTEVQKKFLDIHSSVFDDQEENKLIYTKIFEDYVQVYNQINNLLSHIIIS